jgi:hypothetical protein
MMQTADLFAARDDADGSGRDYCLQTRDGGQIAAALRFDD